MSLRPLLLVCSAAQSSHTVIHVILQPKLVVIVWILTITHPLLCVVRVLWVVQAAQMALIALTAYLGSI